MSGLLTTALSYTTAAYSYSTSFFTTSSEQSSNPVQTEEAEPTIRSLVPDLSTPDLNSNLIEDYHPVEFRVQEISNAIIPDQDTSPAIKDQLKTKLSISLGTNEITTSQEMKNSDTNTRTFIVNYKNGDAIALNTFKLDKNNPAKIEDASLCAEFIMLQPDTEEVSLHKELLPESTHHPLASIQRARFSDNDISQEWNPLFNATSAAFEELEPIFEKMDPPLPKIQENPENDDMNQKWKGLVNDISKALDRVENLDLTQQKK